MSPTALIAFKYSFFLGSLLCKEAGSLMGSPFDNVKSTAILRLISQPPNTYSRKLVDLLISNLATLTFSDLKLSTVAPFLSSPSVVKAVPNSL